MAGYVAGRRDHGSSFDGRHCNGPLCGSLGVPCVLLNAPCDWRWGQWGDHTFLYDSIRLARCPTPMPGIRQWPLPIDGLLTGCRTRWFNMVRLKLSSMLWLARYAGEDFRSAPHIVVLGSCKVGNFVVSTPVLCGLRKRFPML